MALDCLIKMVLARLLHCKVTLIVFVISKNLMGRYFETLQIFQSFSNFQFVLFTSVWFPMLFNVFKYIIIFYFVQDLGHKLACVLLTCPIILCTCPFFLAQLGALVSSCTSLLQSWNQPFSQEEKWREWCLEGKIWARYTHHFVVPQTLSVDRVCMYLYTYIYFYK